MTSEGEVPWYPDESQVPADLPKAVVYRVEAAVHWEGPVAKATASSVFNGNRGEMTLKMRNLQGTTSIASPDDAEFKFAAPIIQQFTPSQNVEFAVGGSCDHVVNFNAHQSARIVIGIADYVVTWSRDAKAADHHAIQPACEKEDVPEEGGGEEGGGSGGTGGGGGGGGDGTITCKTTTYEIQVWNGSEWLHDRYEYETTCY